MHRHYRFLLDAGEGTQRQILKSGLGFKRLNTVLLTHSHLDHILGLAGLASTLSRWENLEELEVYGGRSTLARVYNLLYKVVFPGKIVPLRINLLPLEPGLVIVEDDRFRLSAFPVTHRGPDCFGFLFEERAHRPFLADKAENLGIPFGPERAQLVRGEAIVLPDGRRIDPDDVLGPAEAGTKYVHVGDVGRTDNLIDICQGASVLVIESTYLEQEKDMARRFGHMTAAQAAHLAKDTGIKTLILTHLSRRYRERDIRNEARSIFPDTYVARDLDHFVINRDGATRQNKNAR